VGASESAFAACSATPFAFAPNADGSELPGALEACGEGTAAGGADRTEAARSPDAGSSSVLGTGSADAVA
jgi:hypothetical protein